SVAHPPYPPSFPTRRSSDLHFIQLYTSGYPQDCAHCVQALRAVLVVLTRADLEGFHVGAHVGHSSEGIELLAGSADAAMGTTRGVPQLSEHRFRVKPHAYETPTAGHREEEQHCLPVPRESRADDDVPLAGSRFVSAMDEPKTGAKRDVSRGLEATTADSDAYPDARQSTRIRARLARAIG